MRPDCGLADAIRGLYVARTPERCPPPFAYSCPYLNNYAFMPASKIRVAVFGASGYSGAELLRLLAGHPHAEVTAVTAGERAGQRVGDVYPHLAPFADLVLEPIEADVSTRADAAFLALPHGTSARLAPALLAQGMRVVDLAGDFRLPADAYPEWYGFEHPAPEWLDKAVYGLPELFREEIVGAELVANPGCYPTAAGLALVPPLRAGLIEAEGIVIDAKSGVSGAGAKATDTVHYAHTEGSVRPYRVGSHQHTPEIERLIGRGAGRHARMTFVPHLVPAVRGVLVTCYARLDGDGAIDDLHDSLLGAYRGQPFVRVLPPGDMPDSKRVTGANICEIGVGMDARTHTAVIAAAVDNLVKGASGQAIQNLNLMFRFDETAGLSALGMYP
jgi:N-acetyl-gamma-glutamyl-phosphate reductase